jgi:hypothetical protein
MKKKTKLGQFYTKNSKYIIGNLLDFLPENANIIEPFCGEGDLIITDHLYEKYDLDPKIEGCLKKDTLLEPPSYKDKYIISNPPYLAQNKNTDKSLYNLYKTDDLYKCALLSIKECLGGVLIVPLNFFCDEDNEIRNYFFSTFTILQVNIFEETVFSDTTYTVCSFSFIRNEIQKNELNITCTFFPKKITKSFDIYQSSGWRIGDDFIKIVSSQKNIGIKRLVTNGTPNSNLYLRAIDTGSNDGRISLIINKEHFYGISTDRSFATIILDKKYTDEQQLFICNEFNSILEINREKYNSLFLTNFRNSTTSYARKRISFDVAYKLISYIIKKNF